MKKDIWDILFWIGMLLLTAYIIAKLTGIIQTPEWINLIPVITIAFTIGVFYQKMSAFMQTMHNRTDYLKKNIDKISEALSEHNKRLERLEK